MNHTSADARLFGVGAAPDLEEEGGGDDRVLNDAERSLFRAASARGNYLAVDRIDIVFSAKELCRRMSVPRVSDLTALRRLAKYLLGAPRLVQRFPWQSKEGLSLFTDTDFAGCPRTRRSTNAGDFAVGLDPLC